MGFFENFWNFIVKSGKNGFDIYKEIYPTNAKYIEKTAEIVEDSIEFLKINIPKLSKKMSDSLNSLTISHKKDSIVEQENSGGFIEFMMNFHKYIFYISAYEHENGQGSFFRNYNISSEDEERFTQFSEIYFNQSQLLISNNNINNDSCYSGKQLSIVTVSTFAITFCVAVLACLATWYFTRSQYKKQYKEVSQEDRVDNNLDVTRVNKIYTDSKELEDIKK
jgi:hypothetical protein